MSEMKMNSPTEGDNQNPNNSTSNFSVKNHIDIKPQNNVLPKIIANEIKNEQNSPNEFKMDIDGEDIANEEDISKINLSKGNNGGNNLSNLSSGKNNKNQNSFIYIGNRNSKINENNNKKKESIKDAENDEDKIISFNCPCSNHERKRKLNGDAIYIK